MLTGDEFLLKGKLLLVYLSQRGAVDRTSAVEDDDVQGVIGVDDEALRSLRLSLGEAGLVKSPGPGFIMGENVYPRRGRWWLTRKGLEEASRVASEVRDELERRRKGRIGFTEPSDEGE